MDDFEAELERFKIRFWSKVDKQENGCWIWTAHTNKKGYGVVYAACLHWCQLKAHRVSYYFATGDMPPSDIHVAHKCDNPPCVNPDHLFKATALENVQDRVAKGRSGGTRDRKLTDEQIKELKSDYVPHKRGASLRHFGRKFGVSHMTLRQVINGETYKGV